MNILLLNTLYHPNIIGGAERSVQFLAEALTEKGHRVSAVTSSLTDQDHTLIHRGVEVHYLKQRNVYTWPKEPPNRWSKAAWHVVDTYNPMMARKVNGILERVRPDVLHTNTIGGFSCAVWKAARRRGVTVVHTLRDYYLMCPSSTMFKEGRPCPTQCAICGAFSYPRRRESAYVDGVVGVSRATLDAHLSKGYFSTSQKWVVHNICPPRVARGETLSDRTEKLIRLGFIGRLDPSKGIELFLGVVKQLPESAFRVEVAGQGSPAYENALRSSIRRANVRFHGFISPEEFYETIDFLVVPSLWHEPLSRTILEAFQAGVPVIAGRRGGNAELVEHGLRGYLFDPDSPDELLQILQGLTLNGYVQMQAACREKAREFTPDWITARYVEIYERAREHAAPARGATS